MGLLGHPNAMLLVVGTLASRLGSPYTKGCGHLGSVLGKSRYRVASIVVYMCFLNLIHYRGNSPIQSRYRRCIVPTNPSLYNPMYSQRVLIILALKRRYLGFRLEGPRPYRVYVCIKEGFY